MSYYEVWQLQKYGNVLPSNHQEDEEFEDCIEEKRKAEEQVCKQVELEIIEKEF